MLDDLFAKLRDEDAARSGTARLDEGEIFKALFLTHHPLVINEIFPTLRDMLCSQEFQEKFLAQFRKVTRLKLAQLNTDAQKCEAAGHDTRFYTTQIEGLERQLLIDSLESYQDFLCSPSEGHNGIIEILAHDYAIQHAGSDGSVYLKEHYPLYQIGSLLYECYLAKVLIFERFDRPYAQNLISLYREKLDIELASVDPQFDKYGLLSAGVGFSILNNKESQIVVDRRIGLNFWIDVPSELLAAIKDAIAKCWVMNIAFEIGLITETVPAFEAVEYGSLFSFQALQLPAVSKLCDDECYDDALWIKVDTNPYSMTFEELCADFPILDGNVVTQVVHLEFFMDKGQYFISHLDHEYILYTENAYGCRRYDAKIKGHKKRKTFKIDKARIPFDFSVGGRYFLFLVLDAYFKNKGLIREYFDNVSRGY